MMKIKISKNGKLVGKHETSRVVGASGLELLEESSAGSAVKQSSRKSLKQKKLKLGKKKQQNPREVKLRQT